MELIRASTEWDGVLAYNEMSEHLMLMLPVPGAKTLKTSFRPRSLDDDDFVHALSWFNRNGFPRAKKEIIVDCMETVSKENVLSPVRHYLEDLEAKDAWDKTQRLPRLFQDYFGTVEDGEVPEANSDYLAAIGVKFMIAAVARAMFPGCKVDTMLVLEGSQGAGKSSAARILAGTTYFSDSLPPMNTKDASDHIRGKWIIEVGELSAMQKSEIESTKAFISRQEEKFRPAYRRKEITFKRRCVFIGTTNQDTYLRDETGNRRFWPVAVGKIDLKALSRDRDLLWAEALSRYRAGEKWYLTAAEDQLAKKVQRDRLSEDIWQSELAVALEDETEVAIRGAARRLGLTIETMSRTNANRITAALKALGFVRQGKFTKGDYRNSARYVRQVD
jgi:predicted P-loop ATPase